MNFKFALLLLAFALASCSHQLAKQPKTVQVEFDEFSKILRPKSKILPVAKKHQSLLLMRRSTDRYTKLYLLDHKTRKLILKYDAGRSISDLYRDHNQRNYFLAMDNYGDENYQIYLLNKDFTKATKLFGQNGAQASVEKISLDGNRLYIRSNHLNKKLFSFFVFDMKERKITRRLTPANKSFDGFTISQDEKFAAMEIQYGNNEVELYLLTMKTGRIKKIFGTKGTVYSSSFFHPTKPVLFINSNEGRDRMGCATYEFLTRAPLQWVKIDPNKDINCYYRKKSKMTLMVEEFDGQVKFRLFDKIFGKEFQLPIPAKAIVGQLEYNRGDKYAYTRFVTSQSPGEYYRYEFGQGRKAKLEALTEFNQSKFKVEDFASSYDFNYKSFDGLNIHSIIFAKKDWVKGDKKYPVIVWPHVGPDSNVPHAYSSVFQFWALNGFVVFAPNFRGSTGYGKKFETLNDLDWGGGHITDLVWGKRALSKLPYIDKDRVYIVGASFGGYSTLSAITEYPKEFKGAVAMVALANLFTFYKSVPPDPAWKLEVQTEIGHPRRNKTLYRERSPFFHAHKVAIPLKIYQAENDVRTVKPEMDNFVKRLRSYKIPVQYEVLKKEGHQISQRKNLKKIFQGTIEFLHSIESI